MSLLNEVQVDICVADQLMKKVFFELVPLFIKRIW